MAKKEKINRYKILFRADQLGGTITDLDTGQPVGRVKKVTIVINASAFPTIDITYYKSAKGKNFSISGTARKKI